MLGLLFESFMSRFVSRWFVDDEIEALLVSYRVFRVLLFYVDPGLANKLDEADFVPELYATAWLITLFSRLVCLFRVYCLFFLLGRGIRFFWTKPPSQRHVETFPVVGNFHVSRFGMTTTRICLVNKLCAALSGCVLLRYAHVMCVLGVGFL